MSALAERRLIPAGAGVSASPFRAPGSMETQATAPTGAAARAPLGGDSTRLLLAAVEQAAETIVVTDAAGLIVYANPAFERTTGYSVQESLGKNPRVLKSGSHPPEFYRQMWSTLNSGHVWRGRFTNRRKDGSLYEEDATISAVRDASGSIVNFVAVKRDTTRERLLETQVRRAQRDEAVWRLTSGIVHDFNNLLTVMNGLVDVIGSRPSLADEDRALLSQASEAARRASGLSRRLFSFCHRSAMQPEVTDLNSVILNLTRLLQRTVGEDLTLETRLEEGLPAILADGLMMEQVLMNLVVNARDAMPRGGRVSILTQVVEVRPNGALRPVGARSGRFVLLRVQDTGQGMTAETKGRIFEPFFSTKDSSRGTGLGLFNVHSIVEEHQGWIEVESVPGKGTTFDIFLPIPSGTAEESMWKPAEVAPARGGTETILLVEDEEPVRRLTKLVLERQGYCVVEACSALTALLACSNHTGPIDLVLTDVVLPGSICGPELAVELKSRLPSLKVVYASGYADSALFEKAPVTLVEGVNFLKKPFMPAALLHVVRQALDGMTPTS